MSYVLYITIINRKKKEERTGFDFENRIFDFDVILPFMYEKKNTKTRIEKAIGNNVSN